MVLDVSLIEIKYLNRKTFLKQKMANHDIVIIKESFGKTLNTKVLITKAACPKS